MAGSIGPSRGIHTGHWGRRNRSVLTRGRRRARRLSLAGSVIVASAAIVIAMLPLATPASAAGTWMVTLGAPSGATTTGFVANGTVTPDGEAGFVQVVYEPSGTQITSTSPTAGLVIFNAGVSTPQTVSLAVDQLTPNTSYAYELRATEDDNDAIFDSAQGTFSTTASPTGSGAPINPPNNPSANGIFGQCSGDPACVNDINGVRAAQEQLPPLALPTNWSTLTGPEQMFVWADLERTSRNEVAIPNLVNTYNAAVQAGLTNDGDPSLSDLPGNSASIWAGAYATVLGAIYAWMYDDGPGGKIQTARLPTCRAAGATVTTSSPTQIRTGTPRRWTQASVPTAPRMPITTPSSSSTPTRTAPANIVFTWAQEQPFLVGSTPAPSISGVTLSGTPAAPTVTVTGSNFGSAAPTATPETCQAGDTGNDYGFGGLELQDVTESWGGGELGDCIGLLLTSWSSTKVVFTFGNEYANYGPINAGDQIEVTVQGVTDTVPASFAAAPTITKVSPNTGSTSGGTVITITGTNLTGATTVLFGTVAGTNLKVVSATKITVDSPAQSAGLRNVYVQTPGGKSAAHEADWFTSVVPPTVTKVSPPSGPTTGGTPVTITGTNFTGATTVLFGTVAGTNLKVVSATQITVDSPAQSAALRNVYVETPGGKSAAQEADWFTYK